MNCSRSMLANHEAPIGCRHQLEDDTSGLAMT